MNKKPRGDYAGNHITISLRREEVEALKAEAERLGIRTASLCARFVRLHLKQTTKVNAQRAKRRKEESA